MVKREAFVEKLKTAIWGLGAIDMSVPNQMKYINNGLLGFQKNKDHTDKINPDTGKPFPIAISLGTYFRYKRQFEETPQVFLDLKNTADEGYARSLLAAKKLLEICVKLTGENMFAADQTPVENQHIINSMADKILPALSTVNNYIKRLTEKEKLRPKPQEKLIAN